MHEWTPKWESEKSTDRIIVHIMGEEVCTFIKQPYGDSSVETPLDAQLRAVLDVAS